MERKGPNPPQSLLRALSRLQRRDDIVITGLDKGNGVVILDKIKYGTLELFVSKSNGQICSC